MKAMQVKQIQGRIDHLTGIVEGIESQVNKRAFGWYGVSSTLIPDPVQQSLLAAITEKELLEAEIASLEASIQPYCLPLLEQYGEEAYGWLQEKYTTLSRATTVIKIPQYLISDRVTRWERPRPQRMDLREPILPSVSYEVDRYTVHFDLWAYAGDTPLRHRAFLVGYLPEIDHAFIEG